jgi:NhaP-type Na+/H+ or K+/H+ antiporter
VVGIGIAAQWIAWRVRIPSILFLLLAGWCAGPLLGWIRPDMLMGDLLMPVVALSVGLILFEGGMSLKYKEMKSAGSVTWRLLTFGAAVTWFLSTIAARFLLDFGWPVALLTGAILVVTGPTVIGPMLRHIRPSGQVGSVLKWEGIVIDPIGALLAVLVFESMAHAGASGPFAQVTLSIVRTIVVGGIAGAAAAYFLVLCLRRYWIPDYLQSPVTLALVLLIFSASNQLQAESGLLATTIMGIVLANQPGLMVKQLIQFKENLRVLLLSVLFILLSARLAFDYINTIDWRAAAFALALVLVVRPVSVWVSTVGTKMPRNERLLLAWMAPRGIVAAAITSVFALEMEAAGYADAQRMVPVMFFVIAFTVALYGLTAPWLARRLGVTQPDPRGVLIAGAHPFARGLAASLKECGVNSLLVDRNWSNVSAARLAGLNVIYGDILDESLVDDAVSRGMGRLIAATPNDKVNCLAALQFAEVFEHRNVFQLPMHKGAEAGLSGAEVPRHLMGRILFREGVTYERLAERLELGYRIKATPLNASFTLDDYQQRYGEDAVPLIAVRESGGDVLFAADDKPRISGNAKLIGLVPPEPAQDEAALST